MIYRKTPPQPGRLLLRIVATTGAGTLLGVVACSPSVNDCGGVCGAVSGAEVSGSTGSASGAGAGTGYEAMGVVIPGSGYEGSGSGTSAPYPGEDAASSTDASSSDAYVPPDADTTPPQSEAGASDATLEAGRIILGISVAPPDAGFDQ